MDKNLQGRTALVTGAASGMGKAIALLSGQYGAIVMLSDVDEAKGQAVAEQLKATGANARFLKPTWATRPSASS